MLEVESDSSGILPPRLTTAQRDAQTGWDESHFIYNTTDNCLQIYNGTSWDCLVQGVVIDSSIYRHSGFLQDFRSIGMNSFDLTFDGSGDTIYITSAGFLGIGDPTPEAKLDVEGGTVRFSDYGSGTNIGSESYLLGVDSEGDVIEVTPTIDTFFVQDDQIKLSLQGDRVPFLGINLSELRDTFNIYTDDGTLLTNRIVNTGGNWLRIQGTDEGANFQFQDDGDFRQFGPNPTYQLIDTSNSELRFTINPNDAFISTITDQNLILGQNNTDAIGILNNENIRFYNYGDGLKVGTPAYLLGVEADGDIIEIDATTVGQNIYNTSDTLTSDRQVTLDGNDLTFVGTTDSLIIDASGDVRVTGTISLDGQLEDESGDAGTSGYLLSSTATGTDWIDPDSVGTDDQIIDSLALVNDSLQISIEDDVLRILDLDTLRRGSIDLHDDVDVSTATPTAGDILAWDGLNFVPQPTNNGYTIFEIFAEESSPLGNDQSEWAFGNGDDTPNGHGIVIPLDCELWAITLDHEGGNESTVNIVRNNTIEAGYAVTISGTEQGYNIFPVPLTITAGDVLNFRTVTVDNVGTSGRASAWLRVRSTPASNSLINDLMDVSASTITNGQILVYDGASFVPGDDSDDQIIDSLALVGDELQIGIEGDLNGLQTVDLSGLDNDNQTIDVSTFTATGLNLSLEDDDEDTKDIPLISTTADNDITFDTDGLYLNETDDQIIDSLGLVGNELQIRIEGDANGLQTLDLSGITGSSENIYNTSDSLEADRVVTMDGNSLLFNGSMDSFVVHPSGDISLGTTMSNGDVNFVSDQDQEAFHYVQENGTSGQKDVFTIEDQDASGGSQDHSSVLKVQKSGSLNVNSEGFSLVELAYTGSTDPSDNKYWISGRKNDEGEPLWGVDVTDNDFWSEGGIVLGVTGASDGTYSGGNFIVEPDGDVGIGTTTPGARLEVTGGSVIFDEYGIGTYNNVDTGAVKKILAVDTSGAVVELNTAQNTRWFYAPSVVIDASAEVTNATINLYDEYQSQFATPQINSFGSPNYVPFYERDELWYYVTFFDDQVIENIEIDADGLMEYDIIDVPFDNYTIINIVFVIK